MSILATIAVGVCLAFPGSVRAQPLPRAAIERDTAALVAELEEVYGPRALRTPETWAGVRASLLSIAALAPMDRERLCAIVGSRLTSLADPRVYVTLAQDGASADRCMANDVDRMVGGMPQPGTRTAGTNVAANERALYLHRRIGDVTVLAIRRFEPPDHPGWAGLANLDPQSEAVVVDMRGAGGTDPRAVLQRIWGITHGGQPRAVFREIVRAQGPRADAARAAWRRRNGPPRRDGAVWASFVGPEAPDAPASARPRPVTVLIDAGCEEACQLVARVLESWARASVVGATSTERLLVEGEPGLFVLPRSGIALHFDTTAYVVSRSIERYPGFAVLWGTRSPELVQADPFPGAVEGANASVAMARRIERWASHPPPPCAQLPSASSVDALPAAARARLYGFLRRDQPQNISVTIELPLAQAREWLAGCPGIEVHSTFTESDGSTNALLSSRPTFRALSRLLQTPAVRHVSIQHDRPPEWAPEP